MKPFLWQLLAALLFAVAMVLDKANLRRFKLEPAAYTFMLFAGLVFFSGLAAATNWQVKTALLAEPKYYFGFIALIIFAFLWNKLFYYFEKKEQLQDFEVAVLLEPAMAAVFAGLLFPEERSLLVFLALAVSLAALGWSRLERHHLHFNAYSGLMLLMVVLMGAEITLRKVMLDVFNPATLYFVRTAFILFLLAIFYRPTSLPTHWRPWLSTWTSSLLGTVSMIMMFAGYQKLGVIMVTLIFIASPMFTYFLDAAVLRERIKKKNILAAAVILIAIILASIYG